MPKQAVNHEKVATLLEGSFDGYFGEDFTEEVVEGCMEFLLRVTFTIADQVLDEGKEDEEDDEDDEDDAEYSEEEDDEYSEEEEDEEDDDVMDDEEESDMEIVTDPRLREWIKTFISHLRNAVFANYLDILKICGMDLRKGQRLALNRKSITPAFPYQLSTNWKKKVSDLAVNAYKSFVQNLDIKERPAYKALEIYKNSGTDKSLLDAEEEVQVEAYILAQPNEVIDLEVEELAVFLEEVMDEFQEPLQQMISQLGPGFVETYMREIIIEPEIQNQDIIE